MSLKSLHLPTSYLWTTKTRDKTWCWIFTRNIYIYICSLKFRSDFAISARTSRTFYHDYLKAIDFRQCEKNSEIDHELASERASEGVGEDGTSSPPLSPVFQPSSRTTSPPVSRHVALERRRGGTRHRPRGFFHFHVLCRPPTTTRFQPPLLPSLYAHASFVLLL